MTHVDVGDPGLGHCARDGRGLARWRSFRPGTAQAPGGFAGAGRGAVRAGRLFRHRQPDLERAVVSAGRYRTCRRRGVRGGAYIGVGPDQNFSYIAHIRPAIAFIVDIRRDNLLLHLLFKAHLRAGADARRVPGAAAGPSGAPAARRMARERGSRRLVTYHRRRGDRPPVRECAAAPPRGRRHALRRRALGRRPRDDRPLPSTVHRRGTRAPLPEHRPAAAKPLPDVPASCCSRPIRAGSRETFSRPRTASSSSSRSTRAIGSSRSSVT